MALPSIFNRKKRAVDKSKLPVHIAIIPDGNGRWAKKNGLPRSVGHRMGSNTLKEIVKKCAGLGIKYLTVYTFSTENWKRPKDEVDSLMNLLHEYLTNAESELKGTNVRIKVIGDIKAFDKNLREAIPEVESKTAANTGMQLILALNYGGRDEIIHAIKDISEKVIQRKIKINDINDRMISDSLYTVGIPDPDLIIRTSGEKRSSNFLLWQSAYSELYFSKVLWPDFSYEEYIRALESYSKRQRRYGGTGS